MSLTLKEKILYHQVHPLKLAVDIGCEPVSLYYFWRHDILLGLATHFIPPIAATLLVIRYVDLEPYKSSKTGGYLRRHMTAGVQAVRLIADLGMIASAWRHQPLLIVAAVVAIVAAWGSGWLRK
jgi:hypothetical protein